MKPAIGRIVRFVLGTSVHSKLVERPAVIVEDWGLSAEGAVNLMVFTDGGNDDAFVEASERAARAPGKSTRCVVWRTSVPFSAEPKPGTWHWPERS
jgi:hypothetical protein